MEAAPPAAPPAERLRAAGLRATRPRRLVLALLRDLGGHRSVDELFRARGTPLPRASVYNVLGALAARGLVMLADAGPGRARYEAAGRWHHHFVCRGCGRIVDVPCLGGRRPCLAPPAGLDAEVGEAQVIFRGWCRTCRPRRRWGRRPEPRPGAARRRQGNA